jgi:hypothetical protein
LIIFATKSLQIDNFFLSYGLMNLQELRNWLKSNGKNRQWLADRCKVSIHTVNGWFGGKPISGSAQAIIGTLKGQAPEITAKVNLQEWSNLQKAADKEEMRIDDWIIAKLKEAAAKALLAICILHAIRQKPWTVQTAKQVAAWTTKQI